MSYYLSIRCKECGAVCAISTELASDNVLCVDCAKSLAAVYAFVGLKEEAGELNKASGDENERRKASTWRVKVHARLYSLHNKYINIQTEAFVKKLKEGLDIKGDDDLLSDLVIEDENADQI